MAVNFYEGITVLKQNASANRTFVRVWFDYQTSGSSWNGNGCPFSMTVRVDGGGYIADANNQSSFTHTGTVVLQQNTRAPIYYQDITIYHNSNGEATVYAQLTIATGISVGTVTRQTNATLPPYSQVSYEKSTTYETSAGYTDATLGTSRGFQIINSSNNTSNITNTVSWSLGSQRGTMQTRVPVGTSWSWTPPESLASEFGSSSSTYITIETETFVNGNSIGTTSIQLYVELPEDYSNITINSITISDGMGNYESNGYFIPNESTLTATVDAQAGTGSTIRDASWQLGNMRASGLTANFGTITETNSRYLYVTVTDSRGNTASDSIYVPIRNASAPVLDDSYAIRTNADKVSDMEGTYIQCYLRGIIKTSGSYSIAIYYRATGSSNWTQSGSTTNGTASNTNYEVSKDTTISGVSATTSYEIRFWAQDSANNVTEKIVKVNTLQPVMDFRDGGNGMAVGKINEKSNFFEVGWETDFNDALHVYGNTDLKSNVAVGGTSSFNGASIFSDAATFNEAVKILKNLAVTGTLNTSGLLTASGGANFNAGTVNFTGSTVTGLELGDNVAVAAGYYEGAAYLDSEFIDLSSNVLSSDSNAISSGSWGVKAFSNYPNRILMGAAYFSNAANYGRNLCIYRNNSQICKVTGFDAGKQHLTIPVGPIYDTYSSNSDYRLYTYSSSTTPATIFAGLICIAWK